MKLPKTSDLKFDKEGTKFVRSKMAKAKNIKITINVGVASPRSPEGTGSGIRGPLTAAPKHNFSKGALGEKALRIEKIGGDLRKMKKGPAA